MRFKWTKKHSIGIAIGAIAPLIFIPVVILLFTWLQNHTFGRLWSDFNGADPTLRVKIITIALLSNLAWFYRFLNKEQYNIAQGIILGTILYAPYIIYIKFF
jgi:hypothetical protein